MVNVNKSTKRFEQNITQRQINLGQIKREFSLANQADDDPLFLIHWIRVFPKRFYNKYFYDGICSGWV